MMTGGGMTSAQPRRRKVVVRGTLWTFGVVIAFFLLIMQIRKPNFELSPANGEAGFEAQLHPSSQVHNIVKKSCYNCHSAQGETPWYSRVWPVSVLIESDIRRARSRMDLSNWSNLGTEMSHIRLVNACRMMRESKMPVWYYEPFHPGSAPTRDEADTFCAWVYSSSLDPKVALFR